MERFFISWERLWIHYDTDQVTKDEWIVLLHFSINCCCNSWYNYKIIFIYCFQINCYLLFLFKVREHAICQIVWAKSAGCSAKARPSQIFLPFTHAQHCIILPALTFRMLIIRGGCTVWHLLLFINLACHPTFKFKPNLTLPLKNRVNSHAQPTCE